MGTGCPLLSMTAPLANAKAILREQVRARLKTLPKDERATASARFRARLAQEKVFADAKTILLFAPMPDELDLWPLLNDLLSAGKTVALPRFDSTTNRYVACQIKNPARDVKTGKFGIREPTGLCSIVPLNRLDFILVPGVAFDPHGRRLGRGKGFYDQLLENVRGVTCGVAFDEQIVAEIPVEPHDVRLHCILTPTRWIEP
jgi:5-formyltetrahydrofolate cyclo-ligase